MSSESQLSAWIAKGYLTGQETAAEIDEMADINELLCNEHDCRILENTWDEATDGDIGANFSDRQEELGIWYDETELEEITARFWDTVLEPLAAARGTFYQSTLQLLQPLLEEHELPASVLLVWLERVALTEREAYLRAEGALIE